MADSYHVLAQLITATTTTENVYTVPASTEAIIKGVVIADHAAGGYTVKLSIYKAATAATVVFLPTTTLSAGGHGEYTGAVTLAAGDIIKSYTSGPLSLTILGVERGV